MSLGVQRVAASEQHGNAVVLPDPQIASLPALMLACDQMTHWLRTDPPADIAVCRDLLDKLSAIETYLSKRDQAWAAQTPSRLLEARIGELLGPAVVGRPNVPREVHIERNRAVEFRLMDEYREAWESALPLSRRASWPVGRDVVRRAPRCQPLAAVPDL